MLRFIFVNKILIISFLSFTLAQLHFVEDIQIDKKEANAAGRLPLYSPTKCKENELLYPGDQKDDWICDCAPATVFYPETEKCYKAFRQGPCPNEQFLILFPNQTIPECVANPCRIDGQMLINHRCYEFQKSPPCKTSEFPYVLGVDPKSLRVDCILPTISFQNRFSGTNTSEATPIYDWTKLDVCARGTKRSIDGLCKT